MIIAWHTDRCIRWGHYCIINKETSVCMVYSSQRGWASPIWLLLHLTASFPFPAHLFPPLSSPSLPSYPFHFFPFSSLPSTSCHALPPISSTPPSLPFPSLLSHLLPFSPSSSCSPFSLSLSPPFSLLPSPSFTSIVHSCWLHNNVQGSHMTFLSYLPLEEANLYLPVSSSDLGLNSSFAREVVSY